MRVLLLVLSAVMFWHCDAQEPGVLAQREAPIVNGQDEHGYPAAGALVRWSSRGYYGAFCTATLINDQWLMTAAHCIVDARAREDETYFYTGQNALSPNQSNLYAVSEFRVHRGYNGQSLADDIALIKLEAPLRTITPIPYNTADIQSAEGLDALFIGYGATEGIRETGGGYRRSAEIAITRVYPTMIESRFVTRGTCFGDSGGPAVLRVGGVEKVVGVTSGGPPCFGQGCDPCQTATLSTRVDAYVPWILTQLEGGEVSCQEVPGVCGCSAACMSDGSCDEGRCGGALNCEGLVGCLNACPEGQQSCYGQCVDGSTEEAFTQLEAIYDCGDLYCEDAVGARAYNDCLAASCGAEMDTCFGEVSGELSCLEIDECIDACQTQECVNACFGQGSSQGQEQLLAFYDCMEQGCGNKQGQAFQECVVAECGAELAICYDIRSCNLLGGSCSAGQACYPIAIEGMAQCFESEGKTVGEACRDGERRLACADGLACVDGSCARFCSGDGQCEEAETCLLLEGLSGLGICEGDGSAPAEEPEEEGGSELGKAETGDDGEPGDGEAEPGEGAGDGEAGGDGAGDGGTEPGEGPARGVEKEDGGCAGGPVGLATWPLLSVWALRWRRRRS